jgi:hypothetical protein
MYSNLFKIFPIPNTNETLIINKPNLTEIAENKKPHKHEPSGQQDARPFSVPLASKAANKSPVSARL